MSAFLRRVPGVKYLRKLAFQIMVHDEVLEEEDPMIEVKVEQELLYAESLSGTSTVPPKRPRTASSAGPKRFVCELSGRAFAKPMHLGRHKRFHRQEM